MAVCAGTAAGFAGGVTSGILSGQDLGGVMKSGLIGAGTGLVSGALGGVASTFAPAGALWGSLYGAGTGSVIGGVGSVMTGGDIKEGIIFGAATGLVGGGIPGYCSAKSQGLNPWTGKGTTETLSYNEAAETFGLERTLERIERGESLHHRNDGTVFRNREGLLPSKPDDYYKEYVHPIEGQRFPGPHRVIIGSEGEIYYTPDHYKTFLKIK